MSRKLVIKIIFCVILILINGCTSASSSESLPESDHPYANNFKYPWTVSEPGAAQIRLHFEYIQLASDEDLAFEGYDKLILLDKYDNKLGSYGSYDGVNSNDLWTEWYTGDTLKVKLITDSSRTDYGFKIDKVETRPEKIIADEHSDESNSSEESESLPESDSPYANNFANTWTVNEPGADQIRLHFEYIQLAYDEDLMFEGYDKVILLDENNRELKKYGSYDGVNYQNFWTDWYKGDTLKIKFTTDGSRTDYGFKIDDVDTRSNESEILTVTELSSSDTSSALGQSVTLTAKVDVPPQATEEPSGTVTFIDGNTFIGTVDVNSGEAVLTTSSLSAGSHSIAAKYNGDENFKPSKSSPFALTVIDSTEASSSNGVERNSTIVVNNNNNTQTQALEIHNNQDTDDPKTNPLDIIITIVSGIIVTVVGLIIQKKYFSSNSPKK